MLYVAVWYVSIYVRPVVMRVKEELLLNVVNKINHRILCIFLDYRYIAK